MSLILKTPHELQLQLAGRLRSSRLDKGLRQQTIAERSGVPLPTLRRFERTGEIPFASFVKVAVALGLAPELDGWLEQLSVARPALTIDETILADERRTRKRERGRI